MLVMGSAPFADVAVAGAKFDDTDVEEATEDWDDEDGIDCWLRCGFVC